MVENREVQLYLYDVIKYLNQSHRSTPAAMKWRKGSYLLLVNFILKGSLKEVYYPDAISGYDDDIMIEPLLFRVGNIVGSKGGWIRYNIRCLQGRMIGGKTHNNISRWGSEEWSVLEGRYNTPKVLVDLEYLLRVIAFDKMAISTIGQDLVSLIDKTYLGDGSFATEALAAMHHLNQPHITH